jgi:DNA (cytosine-5)-methyltransferase 1
MMRSPKVIDLFCGAGGFSLGAQQAGFKVIASVDIDEKLTSSYEGNFPNAKLLIADISALQIDALLEAAEVTSADVDGIIGGPPCQGFSTIGNLRE